jgi:hypothetical protein
MGFECDSNPFRIVLCQAYGMVRFNGISTESSVLKVDAT